jgi:hypothetical protein
MRQLLFSIWNKRLTWMLGVLLVLLLWTCKKEESVESKLTNPDSAVGKTANLPDDVYYNKVLGLLVGSAIGDAMGAPTEMWSRKDIRITYGFVDGLDSMVRSPSAEGTWHFNLPAGGTTDDTRWKKLFAQYAVTQPWPRLDAKDFAGAIVQAYEDAIKSLKSTEGFRPEPYEDNQMRMAWLQEWALVAESYTKDDLVGYADAVSKFYGGEMTCAGMLYSPLIGACVPANAEAAYRAAYPLSLFDIGYARDITSLVAAMTAQAFDTTAAAGSITNVVRTVDPEQFFNSRLVGRASYRFYQIANGITADAKALTLGEWPQGLRIPREWQPMDSLDYFRLTHAYSELDKANEDMPFHAGEVYLIAVTAMLYADFDFMGAMTFIVNYGRDNDTVAAIVGSILGAYHGADHLPQHLVAKTIAVNKGQLNNDLEALAQLMTEHYRLLNGKKN